MQKKNSNKPSAPNPRAKTRGGPPAYYGLGEDLVCGVAHGLGENPMWTAGEEAEPCTSAASNTALERTGHTTGFFHGRASVACGPPLTASVRLINQVNPKRARAETSCGGAAKGPRPLVLPPTGCTGANQSHEPKTIFQERDRDIGAFDRRFSGTANRRAGCGATRPPCPSW
jgi:hypothetical protein